MCVWACVRGTSLGGSLGEEAVRPVCARARVFMSTVHVCVGACNSA